MYRQRDSVTSGTAREAKKRCFAGLAQGKSGNSTVACGCFIDVSYIKSSTGSEMAGVLVEGYDGLLIEWAKIGHIPFTKGLCVFSTTSP
jgi:hypothetical protein